MEWCLFVVGLFAAVGWVCLRRPRPRARSVAGREQFFVELVTTATVDEARALAQRLQRTGIVALANAESLPPDAHGRCGFRPFVVVMELELDRARAALAAMQPAEGDAPHDQIAAALAEPAAPSGDGTHDALEGDTEFARTMQRAAGHVWRAVCWILAAVVAIGVWRALR